MLYYAHFIVVYVAFLRYIFFFFFKQKTAYEMRISDWSSDVCSSDLLAARGITVTQLVEAIRAANGATGGSVIEQAEAELMIRSEGYLQSREDFEDRKSVV